jgi:hypothetical protein
VADALPLASGGPCKWHVPCQAQSARVVPAYSGGRLIETLTVELCRRHTLVKVAADRLKLDRAQAFATQRKAS